MTVLTRHAEATRAYTGERPDVLGLAGRRVPRVLDVGCSSGVVAAGLVAPEGVAVGIEFAPDLAEEAGRHLTRVLCMDALQGLQLLQGEGARFDLILFADILEHLAQPEEVLAVARGLLTHGGVCVVSLPNARYYTSITGLLFRGRWPKRERGVHDRTHLRWFTDADARDMFREAGFVVERRAVNYRLVDSPTAWVNRFSKVASVLPGRAFLTYQMLYRLRLGHPGR